MSHQKLAIAGYYICGTVLRMKGSPCPSCFPGHHLQLFETKTLKSFSQAKQGTCRQICWRQRDQVQGCRFQSKPGTLLSPIWKWSGDWGVPSVAALCLFFFKNVLIGDKFFPPWSWILLFVGWDMFQGSMWRLEGIFFWTLLKSQTKTRERWVNGYLVVSPVHRQSILMMLTQAHGLYIYVLYVQRLSTKHGLQQNIHVVHWIHEYPIRDHSHVVSDTLIAVLCYRI